MNIAATSSLSLRMFYHSYSSVATGATRKAASTGTLSMADASALRNAVRKLEDYDFESATKDQIQEKLQAFTDTMNNAITSANKYGAGDTSVRNAVSKLKRLNNEALSSISLAVAAVSTCPAFAEHIALALQGQAPVFLVIVGAPLCHQLADRGLFLAGQLPAHSSPSSSQGGVSSSGSVSS